MTEVDSEPIIKQANFEDNERDTREDIPKIEAKDFK